LNVGNFVSKTSAVMLYTLEKGAVRIAYAHGWLTIKYSGNKKGTFFAIH